MTNRTIPRRSHIPDFDSGPSDLVLATYFRMNSFLFLGFAHEKLNQDEKAENAYQRATAIKGSDPQAWKGLITIYEKQGSKKLGAYHDVALQLGQLYAEK